MAVSNASNGRRAPGGSDDRRQSVVTLLHWGKSPREIAAILDMSISQVNKIRREEKETYINDAGTEKMRTELAAELAVLREDFLNVLQTSEDGALNKNALSGYFRAASLGSKVLGISEVGPIYAEGDLPRKEKDRQAMYGIYPKATRNRESGT